ncbi:MAG TPA: flagellar basal body rod C-terminal domain-containing protein [Malonomonas sp.]
MPLSINTSVSALNALGTRQAVTANNIANLESTEFKKSRVLSEAGTTGSVSTRLQPINSPGVMINQPDGSLQELSNVELEKELTEMIPTRRGYEANLKALQVSGEMEDSALDLIG